MEEDRIGAMYVNHWKRRITEFWERSFPRGFWRSPLLPVIVVGLLILIPGIGWYLHYKGQFHRVKTELKTQIQGTNYSDAGKPGGVDPIVLSRTHTAGSDAPEFLSATVLPGLGMSMLQITAYLPGMGERPLLSAPTMNAIVEGTVGPPNGVNDDHGAFEVPWGGKLMGAATPVGGTILVNWQGHPLEIPTAAGGPADASEGGLLGTLVPDDSQSGQTAQGMQTVGLFKNSSFDDHWVSRTDTQVTVQMNARTMELVVRTKNTGDEPEPMGIGWHPRFEVTKGSRERVQLRLPDGELMEVGEHGKPSGRLVEGSGAVGRLDVRPTELGPMSVDATLVNAKTSAGDSGPALEMRDPAAGYGLRMTAESAAIKALRVTSPADSGYVSLGMQTNLDDPMGKEWVSPDGSDRSGLVTLQPGEVLEWKVKLEIFPVGRP